ncbi:TPA: hypothetical protein QDZ75_002228 [Stenotrophomonas maltophilia]|jgi:hypothetical protein|uniref:Entry exclusion lipoprotein TrbK n=1 Tax=Stenotrophomonas maltophilia TaxID=40324 RepID=A0A2J0U512_STEMA|nr:MULTISPECIES: hypothetical protein [Stenotrophomonas]PJL24030.1 hypothetical protein B9Y64_20935 [Stenotrophomonas maltophilia]HDS1138190.1 hypothetical protein [Stenotrophomonas maltophilia]HDS1146443.1 hypothetical protein [Stenotrophomonas maltophilia]HDS1162158.1 hypothetical protein [Stenotrophomonas maltophilia]HEL5401470.1 hypothetical protein [Stenotrophomonas maltophilia]
MNLQPPLRASLVAFALASLSACATYDDSAMHQACQESPHLKDLPREVAARESRCNKGMEVWSNERKGSDKPIDLSGKKKDL